MTYLILLLLLGAAGMTRLMIAHRKKQNELQSVEGFRTGLEAISQGTPLRTPTSAPVGPRRSRTVSGRRDTKGLDAERRAAARQRIQERRSMRAHSFE